MAPLLSMTQPIVLSRSHPFSTVRFSDLEGPSRRQRLVLRRGPLPSWLREHARLLGPGFDCVVAAMGKARLGSQTRIQSIVVYPAQADRPEAAYVYVTEHQAQARATPSVFPVHVVRCTKLPRTVHFVEIPPASPRLRPSLKLLEALATETSHKKLP